MASKLANSGDEHQKLSPSGLPVRKIPGGYGVPFFSPLRDRLDYYYFQGVEEYFRSRIARHGGATVLRVNMPPGPFVSGDHRVVAVLDARSFRVMLDDSRIDKSGTLDGTFMPSLALFGDHLPLAFLDGADPRHASLKRVMIRLAAARMHHVAPAFGAAFAATFDGVEAGLAASGAVEFNKHNMRHMLDFTCAALFGGALPSNAIGDDATAKAFKWLVFQLHPLASKAIKPWLLEDLLLHTFRLPPFLVRGDYAKLTAYFTNVAAGVLDDAEKADPGSIPRDELLHNLIFLAIFNAYGGYKIFLPHLVKWLARAGPELHGRLADEVRAVVPTGSTSAVTLTAVEKMPLVKSVVWETLRMNPPVEFQYGRAREDTIIESHDAAYEVKKGEMLCGYQPLATRDERVFQRGREFVPDRFAACSDDDRRRLLEHVVWSNGPETGEATEGNKQCPGKDAVVAVGRLMVAELFRRYDTFAASVEETPLEPVVTITSLTKAAAVSAGHGDGKA
ncbi:Allene oxide synthase 4 [Dichanthelium oligosanthes]|uniref:hydroperoxide dehydratase n=1 Tax=Dichanthelium oligosanthes TaxID=888268 RepID=A0A1E5UXX7_9POAL|nr:Allene oxide synthase 4 [Dichanthelium oligosanthes]